MPFTWTPEAERTMLLYTLLAADVKPPKHIWDQVAAKLGEGVNGNAVSQKFYKLKRDSEKLLDDSAPAPTTPATKTKATKANGSKSGTGAGKRKKSSVDDDADEDGFDSPTATKAKSKKSKQEPLDGGGDDSISKMEQNFNDSEDTQA